MTASTQAGSVPRIAVVIPSYKVRRHILPLLAKVPAGVSAIYVVDDACPEGSGDLVEAECRDPRVRVVRNARNLGVGGAVMAGYRQAIADGADVMVKIDGDGQMDPALVDCFVAPILRGEADYTKGNRFFDLAQIHQMPLLRIVGNASLSLLTKLSTGYWDVFDPTNGYTAVHARVAGMLPFDKISTRYFFESDMLFRLGTFRAVVVDVPMDALYGEETSGLRIGKIIVEFSGKHLRNFAKRLLYNYFLRDFPLASLELVAGLALIVFGAAFGGWHWWLSASSGIAASAGTVMIPTMSLLVGLQLLLAFLAYDIANLPRRPVQSTVGGGMRPPHVRYTTQPAAPAHRVDTDKP